MPLSPDIHVVDLPEMSAKVVGTPEYILPFLLELRAGWLMNRFETSTTQYIGAMLNLVILNTELMIEKNQS